MSIGRRSRIAAVILTCITCITCFTTSAFAVDGVVLIDQARALAGNVTPGDTPGFPVTINLTGSYRLSGNLTVPADTNGIQVAADNVTLDFNGYQIAGSNGTGFGVTTGEDQLGVVVRNGSVTNFAIGIRLSAARGGEVTQIRATGNSGTGISAGDHAIVTGNNASGNDRGISIGDGSLASGNVIFENASFGLRASLHTSLINNVVTRNPHDGILVACPSNLVANTSIQNGSNLSFQAGFGCTSSNNNFPATP